ncbi:MAG: response regulator [Candidatus Pacebacteria bacterium]|nr:response regulator [Candidatus Paceibacterota bacterium]
MLQKKGESVPVKPAAKAMPAILIIEDDINLAEMYKTKLDSEGFKTTISPDGKDGIKAIRDLKPDLVLLDILMAKKDGFDVLSSIGRCPIPEVKNTPVIVLTNLASPVDQEEGKRLGARDWWIKAFNTPAEVANKVKEFLKIK